MRQAWRGIAGLLAVGALTAGGSVALADDGGGHGNRDNNGNRGNALATTIFTMPAAPDGNPEGVAFDKSSGRFFVSRTATGAIFSGTLDTTTLSPFIAGGATGAGPLATGLKVRNGVLYVAGATTGEIRVYNLATPTAPPVVFQTGGGFINDLDVTESGDVYATDSFKPFIYKVDAAAVAAGGPATAVTPINVAPEITVDTTPGVFNLNGIVASRNGDELTVVQSNTGKLYRITFGDDNANDDRGNDDNRARTAQATPPARTIEEIEVDGGPLTGGDGLLKDRGRLLVVRGSTPTNANGAIDVVKLRHHRTRGRVESEVSDPSFAGPSTVARARNLLLVVNANFAGGATATQFTVTGLARNAVRHGGHGGHGGGGHGGGGDRHGGHGGR
jgi:sugar lactone lactonase YvrE